MARITRPPKENERRPAAIYKRRHKISVRLAPINVAIVGTHASVSALISGTAEYACIATAHSTPAAI